MNARTMRMGELLGRIANLSAHDVEEILAEQSATRRRFGELAVEMGMCRQRDVWTAWCAQLSISQHVDLNEMGVDAQAAAMVPAGVARAYGVVAVRTVDGAVVVAVTAENYPRARAELPGVLECEVRFVIACAEGVGRAMETYYPKMAGAA